MIETPEFDGIARTVRPAGRVTETTLLDRGNRKRTTIVRFAEADAIVVQQSDDASTIQTEARLLDAIADRTSIPVVRPLATGEGWLVTPFVPGADLHEQFTGLAPTDRRRIVERFGRGLAELHDAFAFEGYGRLSADQERLRVAPTRTDQFGGGLALAPHDGDSPDPTADWAQWLQTVAEAAIARLPSEFDGLAPRLRETVARWTVDAEPTPRLFPWDFRPGNALVDGAELAAVLDWEGPLSAAPGLSYAKTEYLVADWYVLRETARELRSAFRRGYAAVREPPTVGPAHRITAIASTAVDSRGTVTNPRYPPVKREAAIDFHRESLRRVLK